MGRSGIANRGQEPVDAAVEQVPEPAGGEEEARELEHEQAPEPELIPLRGVRALYGAIVAVVLALLVIDVTAPWGWDVADTTIALLLVLVTLPIVGRIRSLSIGTDGVSFELERRVRRVERGLAEETQLSSIRDANVSERVDELEEAVAPSPIKTADPGSPVTEAPVRHGDDGASPRPHAAVRPHPLRGRRAIGAKGRAAVRPAAIDRIVWVDDEPSRNELYRRELARRWTVVTAVTTSAGKALIDGGAERTLVITDAVRVEEGVTDREAGLELLSWLGRRHPFVPALVFAGPGTVRDHSAPLRAVGAKTVTADFAELLRTINLITARRLHEFVVELAEELNLVVDTDVAVVDLLARDRDGSTIAIEAKAWHQPPSRRVFLAAIDQLELACGRYEATGGLLVLPAPLPDGFMESVGPIPPALEIVAAADLENRLQGGDGL